MIYGRYDSDIDWDHVEPYLRGRMEAVLGPGARHVEMTPIDTIDPPDFGPVYTLPGLANDITFTNLDTSQNPLLEMEVKGRRCDLKYTSGNTRHYWLSDNTHRPSDKSYLIAANQSAASRNVSVRETSDKCNTRSEWDGCVTSRHAVPQGLYEEPQLNLEVVSNKFYNMLFEEES